jgi:hypothetical protein
MCVLATTLEHDPEKWKPVLAKIMLKQSDEIMIRFSLIGSRSHPRALCGFQ